MSSPKPPSVLAVAAGIVSIRCLPLLLPFVSYRHTTAYHERGPLWRLLLPILIDCAIVWLLCVISLTIIRRWQRAGLVFWTAFFSVLPLIAVRTVCFVTATVVTPRVEEALSLLGLLIFCVLLLLAWRSSVGGVQRSLRLAETIIALTAWSGAVLLGQSLWSCYAADHASEPPLLRLSPDAPPRPTILWILFDELSENQLFDHRFPGLALPAFDRFASQSTNFASARAANFYTQSAMPGLMTGLPVDQIRASADGGRLTLDLRSGAHQPFDPQQTVFGDAQRLGYPTSVVGWYNPYCRMLPDVLNRCTWVEHSDDLPGGFRTNTAFNRNLPAAFFGALPLRERLFGRIGFQTDQAMRGDHISEYRRLEAASLDLLVEPHPGFVMLHIAAPHPQGIYDRKTGMLSDTGPLSYIDNLALADRFLGEVEEALSRNHQWDQATIVIMGDHSWRTRMWRTSAIWTPEDEIASQHGAFDDRPAYLVKLPGQHAPARIDAPYDALRSRALFNQILAGSIKTPEQLAAWAAQP